MISIGKSIHGKKARAPVWWGRTIEVLPKIYIPFLEPHTWTPELARKWIDAIPSKCPFERQLWWGDRLILYIPPLCPFNPISSQLYRIRIEAQEFLRNCEDS